MRMPDSSNKHTFPLSVTLQRCWSGSVGRVVDGDTVVVVPVDTAVADVFAADGFTVTTMLDAFCICNALE